MVVRKKTDTTHGFVSILPNKSQKWRTGYDDMLTLMGDNDYSIGEAAAQDPGRDTIHVILRVLFLEVRILSCQHPLHMVYAWHAVLTVRGPERSAT